MRRRLDIVASLIVTPDLLFLDEPTTGTDPRSRNQVWELVRQIAAAGATALLTIQYLEEADQLAGQIAVIDHGRIVAEGTSAQLETRAGPGTLHVRLLDGQQRPGHRPSWPAPCRPRSGSAPTPASCPCRWPALSGRRSRNWPPATASPAISPRTPRHPPKPGGARRRPPGEPGSNCVTHGRSERWCVRRCPSYLQV